MEAAERIPLHGYGSATICRMWHESSSFKSSPEFGDAAQQAVAIAIAISCRLARVVDAETSIVVAPCSISQRQIFEAAAMLFPEVQFNESMILKHAEKIPSHHCLKNIQLDMAPEALRNYIAEKGKEFISSHNLSSLTIPALDVVVIATVAGIGTCKNTPLIAYNDWEEMSNFWHRIILAKGPIVVAANALFGHICWLLAGIDPNGDGVAIEERSPDVFMVSEFGWTVCLPTFGDTDPASVNPAKLFLREGVPTDKKTLESKGRVRDALAPGIGYQGQGQGHGLGSPSRPQDWIIDNGMTTYRPRSASQVAERSEFYGSRNDGFHLTIKFTGHHLEPFHERSGRPCGFSVQKACRAFHDNLWSVLFTPPCKHAVESPRGLGSAKLSLDVVTTAGHWSWHADEKSKKRNNSISERIIVVLVKGDARARWLAVGVALEARDTRRTMLRGHNCCEECTVEAASQYSGKWFVII